ncbi:MAG: sensor histidine kinase, partial [Bacteroidota bacterium]
IIGFVAHDLRGPLASNIGLQKLLLHKIGNSNQDTDINNIFNYLELNNNYLTEVTDDLVEAANLERDDFSIELSKENLSEILSEIELICEPEGMNKKLNIFIQKPEEQIIINLSKEKIKRALLNIISNAIKFTPENGSIFFTVEVVNNFAVIKIKDTGVGISEENIKVVFDKFSKASRKGVRGEKSNGLGLYIVAKIIEIHGGEISIKSQEMEGTEISVSLHLTT